MTMKKAGLLFIFILHLLILSKLIFTAWPEMLSYPYLFAKGFLFYKDFIMPYPPALILFLSVVFNIFGFTPEVLKTLTWILIISIDIILFLILQKITKRYLVAIIFLGVFIFLQSFLEGNMLWFDFATVLPLLLSFYFILKWLENSNLKNMFLISFFLTLAILVKQTAAVYFLGFLGFYFWGFMGLKNLRELKGIGVIGGGILILIIPLLIFLIKTESLIYFWNWIFLYPLTEWSKFPGYVDFTISRRETIVTMLLLSPLMFSLICWKKLFASRVFLMTSIFTVAALIAVYPRFSFFHLQPTIAFLVIIFAKIFCEIPKRIKPSYLSAIFITTFFIVILSFKNAVGNQVRFYLEVDQMMAQKIAQVVENTDKVFFLGVNSSEYVFANKIPPKNWSDNFGWYLEIPGVQEWVIKGFKNKPPEKILWRVPSKGEWYRLGVYQPQKITEYIRKHYRKTGNIETGVEIWERN